MASPDMAEPVTGDRDLSNAEYVAMQSRLELIARLAVETDETTLDLFIAQAERADTLGPLLDPSLWLMGHAGLRGVITHARALARFASAVRETL